MFLTVWKSDEVVFRNWWGRDEVQHHIDQTLSNAIAVSDYIIYEYHSNTHGNAVSSAILSPAPAASLMSWCPELLKIYQWPKTYIPGFDILWWNELHLNSNAYCVWNLHMMNLRLINGEECFNRMVCPPLFGRRVLQLLEFAIKDKMKSSGSLKKDDQKLSDSK